MSSRSTASVTASTTGKTGSLRRTSDGGGRRARPPEDCGGPWGFREFLAAVGDPDHEEHASMLEWVGGHFDPEAFDLADFEQHLKLGRLVAK